MKTLHLTLKKKWFAMILSGEKKEEYRDIKPYWNKRMKFDVWPGRQFDVVCFKNGYAKDAPELLIELLNISVGKARPEWSDNWQGDVFVLKLGNILETKNINQIK